MLMKQVVTALLVVMSSVFFVCSCNPVDSVDIESEIPGVHDSTDDGSGVEGNKYDFDFTIGFEYFADPFWSEEDRCYVYGIFMGFGVPSGLYDRGINEFGIEVHVSDGEITNNSGWDEDVYVSRNGTWVCFSGLIMSSTAHNWGTLIFVHSKEKHIELSYRWRLFDNEAGKYVNGASYGFEKSENFYVE